MAEPVIPAPAPLVVPAAVANGTPEVHYADDPDVFAKLGALAQADLDKQNAERGEEPESINSAETEAPPEVTSEETPAVEEGTVVSRALAAAAKARESAGKNRSLMAQQKALSRQHSAAQQQIQQLRQQNEQAARFQQQLAQDPYKALKTLGMTEEDLARRAIREGTPEAAIEQIQQQLAQERQARLSLENRLVQERHTAHLKSAELGFLAETTKDNYPILSELPEKVALLLAKNATEELIEDGYDLSGFPDADLCAYVEHKLKTEKRVKKKADDAAGKDPNTPGVKKAPIKTITNSLGTKKYSMPANFDSLDDEEKFFHLGKIAENHKK